MRQGGQSDTHNTKNPTACHPCQAANCLDKRQPPSPHVSTAVLTMNTFASIALTTWPMSNCALQAPLRMGKVRINNASAAAQPVRKCGKTSQLQVVCASIVVVRE